MRSYRLKSHPEINLKDHIEKVHDIGLSIFDKNKVLGDYRELLRTALIGHDLGKGTSYFQDYINGGKSHGELKNHGFISALMTYTILKKQFEEETAILGLIAVKRHHGNLRDITGEMSIKPEVVKQRKQTLQKQLDSIDMEEINSMLSAFSISEIGAEEIMESFNYLYADMEGLFFLEDYPMEDRDKYFIFKYIYSILIYSDKSSLIVGDLKQKDLNINSCKLENYLMKVEKSESEININRSKAKFEVEKKLAEELPNIMTITLPTGMGKTLNSVNFAVKLKEKLKSEEGIEPGIVYAFPFTSIIDQTYGIFEDIFGNDSKSLLKHHYLSEIKYKDEEDYYEIEQSKFLIETWESKLVVTTFIKLVEAVFSNKNSQILKFHKLSNAIVILDEVQNIPYRYWKLIEESFKVISRLLNTKFVMMTATQPMIIGESKKLVDAEKYYFSLFNRTKLVLRLDDMNLEEFVESVKPIVEENSKVTIVLNTVKAAQEVYKKLKGIKVNSIFLSASVVPKDRKARIELIKSLKEYLVVSTQVIEAGVDIDNDVVIRDIGPWDSIVQCAGRCNRHNKNDTSEVYIYKLKGSKKVYANMVYGAFLIDATEQILKEKREIYESEFYEYSNKYFEYIKENSSKSDSDGILKSLENLNFLRVDSDVNLIEDRSGHIIPVFIELDEEAEVIWEKYQAISGIWDGIERRNEFLKIKDKFYSYIININVRDYKFEYSGFYNRIPRQNVEDYYSEEYGFYIDDDKTMFF